MIALSDGLGGGGLTLGDGGAYLGGSGLRVRTDSFDLQQGSSFLIRWPLNAMYIQGLTQLFSEDNKIHKTNTESENTQKTLNLSREVYIT